MVAKEHRVFSPPLRCLRGVVAMDRTPKLFRSVSSERTSWVSPWVKVYVTML